MYHDDDLATHVADELDQLMQNVHGIMQMYGNHVSMSDLMGEFDVGYDEAQEMLRQYRHWLRHKEREARG